LAESEGFEPPNAFASPDFESGAFSRSASSPIPRRSRNVARASCPALLAPSRPRCRPASPPVQRPFAVSPALDVGGEGGIRTHDTLPYTRFPSVRLRPLGHLSSTNPSAPSLPASQPARLPGVPPDLAAQLSAALPPPRLPRKKPRSRSPHSAASTPLVTSIRWFSRGSRAMSNSVPTAPAFGSGTA
jgi:hypothetical protein